MFENLFVESWTVSYITENKFGDEYVREVEFETEDEAISFARQLEAANEECVTVKCDGVEVTDW